MSNIVKLFAFVLRHGRDPRSARRLMALVVATGILSGAASAGFVMLINATLNHMLPRPVLIWTFIGLCVTLPLFRFLSTVLLMRLVQTVLLDLRLQLARNILSAPLRHLESVGPAALLSALTEDIGAIVAAVGNLPLMALHMTVVLGCLIYLGFLSWGLLGLVLAFLAVGVATYQVPLLRAQRHFIATRSAWDQLFKGLRGLTEGTKELKVHAPRRAAFVNQLLEPSAEALRRHTVVGNTIFAAANSWGQVLFFVVIGLLLFALPGRLAIDARTMTGFMLALLYMMTPLDVLLNMLPGTARAGVAVNKVESLGLSLEQQSKDAQATIVPPPLPPWQRIDLLGVAHSFRCNGEEDSFTLGPLDLVLQPEVTTFVIGGNGSGKTTLAKLLLGLYSPEQGEVRLDGKPVTDGDRDAYRQLFSAVFADFYLFESLLGLERSDLDAQALKYLLDLHLADKVKVKHGVLSTLDLSQGQRKRLALLTSYLEDRPIYLFDEWAADQDPYFKDIFYTRLLPELKARQKTVVVITHDDRYYSLADRIVKLESGKITFDGRGAAYGAAPGAAPPLAQPVWPAA